MDIPDFIIQGVTEPSEAPLVERLGREGMRFDRDEIFGLDFERSETMRKSGVVALTEDDFDFDFGQREIAAGALVAAMADPWDLPFTARQRRAYVEPKRGWVFEGYAEIDRPKEISETTWLAHFDEKAKLLRRVVAAPVGGWLATLAVSCRGVNGTNAPFDFLAHDLAIDPVRPALEVVSRSGFYEGVWSACDCGMWDDHASLAHIWGGTVFTRIDLDGGAVCGLHFLPLPLPAEAREERRRAREAILAERSARISP